MHIYIYTVHTYTQNVCVMGTNQTGFLDISCHKMKMNIWCLDQNNESIHAQNARDFRSFGLSHPGELSGPWRWWMDTWRSGLSPGTMSMKRGYSRFMRLGTVNGWRF